MITLRADFADRPNVRALLNGDITATRFLLNNCGPRTGGEQAPNSRPFDIRELSLVDYLQARARGADLVMLPAVMLGRFHHGHIACHSQSSLDDIHELAEASVAVRWPLNTSTIWTRAILHEQYGIDPGRVRWVYQGGAGSPHSLLDLVLSGDADAAVPLDPERHPELRRVVANSQAAIEEWLSRFGVAQVNHVAVIRGELSRDQPELVQELYDLLKAAKSMAPATGGYDCLPFGARANHRSLEMLIDALHGAGLLARRVAPESLYDDTTRALD